jgi:hypothetical protein
MIGFIVLVPFEELPSEGVSNEDIVDCCGDGWSFGSGRKCWICTDGNAGGHSTDGMEHMESLSS